MPQWCEGQLFPKRLALPGFLKTGLLGWAGGHINQAKGAENKCLPQQDKQDASLPGLCRCALHDALPGHLNRRGPDSRAGADVAGA